jgi:hypothetical protein
MKSTNAKEWVIQNIKQCGQSLIDNAERIVSDFKYEQYGITITCKVGESDRVPTIEIKREYIPEGYIEHLKR